MKFGKNDSSGKPLSEATECILTGRAIAPPFENTVCHRVAGTAYFYRVLGSQYHRMTDELRTQWETEAKALDKPAYNTRSNKNSEVVKE